MNWPKFLIFRSSSILASLLFLSPCAFAKTLMIPLPNALNDEAALLPSIMLGEPGFSFDSALHANSLPSTLSMGAALPFSKSSDARSAGWMWALKAGISDFNYVADKIFYPGSYFYEIALGRGTASDDAEFYKGLRGYMEVSLRTERPKFTPNSNLIASNLGINLQDNQLYLGIKMGTASSSSVLPVIGQTQSRISYQVRSQFLFPIKNTSYSLWKVDVEGQISCVESSLSCGFSIGHVHINNTSKNALAEDLSDLTSFSLTSRWAISPNLSLQSRLAWSLIGNRQTFRFEKVPTLILGLVKAF